MDKIDIALINAIIWLIIVAAEYNIGLRFPVIPILMYGMFLLILFAYLYK